MNALKCFYLARCFKVVALYLREHERTQIDVYLLTISKELRKRGEDQLRNGKQLTLGI